MLYNHQSRGVVLVWVALVLLILIGFVGLALDSALIVLTGQQLQAGADASALGGAGLVRINKTQAQAKAIAVAAANKAGGGPITLRENAGNDAAGDYVIGRFYRDTQIFSPQLTSVNAVQVVARRTDSVNGPLPLLFGPIFGVNTASLERKAIAMSGGGTGAGLITLDPVARDSLVVDGKATITVNNGDMQINSSDSRAADFRGNVTVDADSINIVGNCAGANNVPKDLLHTGASSIPDPLAYLPEPAIPATDLGQVKLNSGSTGVTNIGPGYYSGGIFVSGGTLNLSAGIYVLGGKGLDIQGGIVKGDGVMLYIVDTGRVNIQGGAMANLTPPDPDKQTFTGVDTYDGVLIFQARNNNTAGSIEGGANLNLIGSIYFPDNLVSLSGTSSKIGTQFIADQLKFAGGSNLTINYNGNLAAPGNRVFLVY